MTSLDSNYFTEYNNKDYIRKWHPIAQRMQMTERLYFHAGCPDGIMARNAILKVLPNLKEYPVNPSSDLEVTDNALFVDVCPKDEDSALDFLKRGAILLDHHESNRYLFDKYSDWFPGQMMFGENQKLESGAVLGLKAAIEYMYAYASYRPLATELLAAIPYYRLAGLADCFLSTDPDFEDARALANFVGEIGNDYRGLPHPRDLELARSIARSKKKRTIRRVGRTFRANINGYTVFFLNSTSDISDLAEHLRNEHGADLLVGYSFGMSEPDLNQNTHSQVSVSLRSNERVNCREIASKNGGGGHDRAAGFKIVTPTPGTFDIIGYFEGLL